MSARSSETRVEPSPNSATSTGWAQALVPFLGALGEGLPSGGVAGGVEALPGKPITVRNDPVPRSMMGDQGVAPALRRQSRSRDRSACPVTPRGRRSAPPACAPEPRRRGGVADTVVRKPKWRSARGAWLTSSGGAIIHVVGLADGVAEGEELTAPGANKDGTQ